MAGRKKTPTKLKIIRGTNQKCRSNPAEAQPDPAIPSPPECLGQAASVEWGRVSQELYQLGLLSRIDRTALAAYCQAYSQWAVAVEAINEKGLFYKTPNGHIQQSPAVGIANVAADKMHKFLTEFGMTPASRARVRAEKPTEDAKTGFGGL